MGASLNGKDVAITAVLANGSTGSGGGSGDAIIVDSELSLTSKNPVQNNVVTAAINDVKNSCVTKVDSALLVNSTNPVQNKVVTAEIETIRSSYLTKGEAEKIYVKAGEGTYATSGRFRGEYSPLEAYQANDVIYYQGGNGIPQGWRHFTTELAPQSSTANIDNIMLAYTQPFNLGDFGNDRVYVTGSEVYSEYLPRSEAANTYAKKGETGGGVEVVQQSMIAYENSGPGGLKYYGMDEVAGTTYVGYTMNFANSTLGTLEIDIYRHKYVFNYLGTDYQVYRIHKGDSNKLADATIYLKNCNPANITFSNEPSNKAAFYAYERAHATVGGIELFAPPEMEIIG